MGDKITKILMSKKSRDVGDVIGEGNGTPLQYSCLEKSHGRRSLVGCSPQGREELDTTERLHFHFSLSCFGEGNGNPLQCSCLENPRDGGAWWAAVYGVTQSQTRLKRLSSSSRRCDDRGKVSDAAWERSDCMLLAGFEGGRGHEPRNTGNF